MKHNSFFSCYVLLCVMSNFFTQVLCFVELCENRNFSSYVMCYVSDFLDRGESGRSNWVKVDGPGSKWMVQKDIKFTDY